MSPVALRRLKPVARFRLRVSAGDQVAIGPGKVALLEAIRDEGSLTAAAKSIGISYRRAWTMLDEMQRTLKYPVVASATGGPHGGGSLLTAVGEEIVARYRRIEAAAAASCAEDIQALLELVA